MKRRRACLVFQWCHDVLPHQDPPRAPEDFDGADPARVCAQLKGRGRVTVELTDDQAWQLAQFVKRVGVSDLRVNADSDVEACRMLTAIAQIQRALAQEGYAPR
jgi:hypothetical protein